MCGCKYEGRKDRTPQEILAINKGRRKYWRIRRVDDYEIVYILGRKEALEIDPDEIKREIDETMKEMEEKLLKR